jgi:hypothetical protein
MEPHQIQKIVLDRMRQYRHDWLNHFQLLYSYLQLQKYEECHSLCQNIISECENEKNIFNIGNPELSVFLLTELHHYPNLQLNISCNFVNHEDLRSVHIEMVAVVKMVLKYLNDLPVGDGSAKRYISLRYHEFDDDCTLDFEITVLKTDDEINNQWIGIFDTCEEVATFTVDYVEFEQFHKLTLRFKLKEK